MTNEPKSRLPEKEAEPVDKGELQAVREGEKAVAAQGEQARTQNIFIGTLNVIAQPLKNVYDPIKKVCYEPLAAHYEGKYRSKFPKHHSKIFVLDMALLAVIGALAVFWFFANTLLPLFPVAPLVRLAVLAPKTIVSGETADYVISYDNDSAKTLGCAELRIHLPPDTVLSELPSAPGTGKTCAAGQPPAAGTDDPEVRIVPLGDIGPNGRDVFRFKAKTYGPTGGTKVMTTELLYWEEAATAPSRVSSRDEWQVTSSALALTVDVPKGVSRGYAQAIAIGYANRGTDILPNAALRLSPPDDFVVTGAQPAPSGRNEWSLGTIEPGAEGTITVFGYFRATGAQQNAPTFAVRGYADTDQGGRVLVELVRENADPAAADIEFSQEIVQPAGRQALMPGETVRVQVRYRNAGQKTLKDVHVAVDPGATYVNSPSPAALAWDKAAVPALAEVKPGDEGTLEASFAVDEMIGQDAVGAGGMPSLHVASRASYEVQDDPTRPVLIDTQTADLPVATRLGLNAAALYFTKDGDQLGIGPLPPKVGQTTKYRVFLTVTTTTGDADEATVDAYLPSNVAWTGHASVTAGDAIDYFPSTGRVRWHISHIPAFADGTGTRIVASFEVAITPTKGEIGSVPPLVKTASVSGTDASTGLGLHATAADVTTDLPYDQRAAGKGAVVK